MAPLDELPPDQRAVLDLVLARGRSYDDIARLLAIDRAAVRARALAAFDELGPDTGIATESRALIADYLLGQLPERVAEQTRERLASSPYERAWARVLASELAPMASKPLPEIPDGSRAGAPASTEPARPAPDGGSTAAPDGDSTAALRSGSEPGRSGGAAGRGALPRERGPRRTPRLSDRPSSRLGGAILLALGVLLVVGVVVALIAVLSSGSSTKTGTTGASHSSSVATGTTTSPQAQVVAQNNLNPPSGSSSKAKGVGLVVKLANAYGIVIEAQNVPPNNHNAYAAWLYNSPADVYRLGFVSPPVGTSGRLEVGTSLPANAGRFKQLLLTVETTSNPKTPGAVVLQGPFTGVPATG